MDPKYIIVMGTFRTGSTFLAKALSAHRNITVPSDPYFYFFKALRNEIFKREGYANFDKESPVSDNFHSEFIEINSKIRDYSLKIPIQYNSLEEILDKIGKLARRDSPKIVPLLKEVTAKDYYGLFKELMKLARQAYGDDNTIYCGFKVIFAEQFLAPLLNTFPDLKCIYLVRDPRAVVASQNAFHENSENKRKGKNRGRYPLLYVIRQWRKSFAYLLDNIGKKENIFFLKYEDIIAYPEKKFREICAFLNLDYDSNMCNADQYKNGAGNLWTQNSSYGTSTTISAKFMNKWKQILSEREIQLVEDLCSPEMKLLGYKRTTEDDIFSSVLNVPHEDIDKIDPWIRDYLNAYTLNKKEAEKELLRRQLMTIKNGYAEPKLLERIYIAKNYLKNLKNYKLC